MKAAGKMSRNARRKVDYAAKADKSSRNQETIGVEPVVGRWETVTVDDDGRPLKQPYKRIVHDGALPSQSTSVVTPRAEKRASDAQKKRRQAFAWGNCRLVREGGQHNVAGANCKSCGAPG